MKKNLYKSVLICVLAIVLTACYKDIRVESEYNNGDTIIIVPVFYGQVDSISFFWDDKYIGTQKKMPFIHEYKLVNEISGEHECRWTAHSNSNVTSYNNKFKCIVK